MSTSRDASPLADVIDLAALLLKPSHYDAKPHEGMARSHSASRPSKNCHLRSGSCASDPLLPDVDLDTMWSLVRTSYRFDQCTLSYFIWPTAVP